MKPMTDHGFSELVKGINAYGYHFPIIPLFRVNTSMFVTAKEILKKEMVLNEYEDFVLPDINEGRTPDIEASAKKAGVDIETVRDVVEMIMGKTKR